MNSADEFDTYVLKCVADFSFPEPTQWNGDDTRPMPSVENDDARERDANWLLSDMVEFRKAYGLKALVRLVAEASE